MAIQKAVLYTGQDLREMFAAAAAWLEKSAREIDALNVFPVPDGDTGTNMSLTMKATMEEAQRCPERSVSTMAQAMARGALMGARGNSGVILSQIFRGLALGLATKDTFGGNDLAQALEKASVLAYRGMSHPVEGTMLTVISDAARAAQEATASNGHDVVSVLDAAVTAARHSVARTPSLLPVLRQAGVVDAGGQGVYIILEGALRCLRGEIQEMTEDKPEIIPAGLSLVLGEPETEEKPYGYCTEFLLQGQGLDSDGIRKNLEKKGESLMVVGNGATIRVHIHTYKPGDVLRYATRLGTLHQIQIRNMDDQHQEFKEMRRALAPSLHIATIAVASGEGMTEVFRSLGTTAIVPGGKTMNPSIQELLRAIEAVPSQQVILLPNDKNIIPAAQQAQGLTAKKIMVIPTESIPQGVAALLSFNPEAGLEANASAMEKAKRSVRTVAITRAVRPARYGVLEIKRKQAIALMDGEPMAATDSLPRLLEQVFSRIDMGNAEVVTIYYGENATPAQVAKAETLAHHHAPQAQVEVVNGGQPHYNFIISVEE